MTGDWLTGVAGFTDRERAIWELLRQDGVAAAPSWIAVRLGVARDDVPNIETACLNKLLAVARHGGDAIQRITPERPHEV